MRREALTVALAWLLPGACATSTSAPSAVAQVDITSSTTASAVPPASGANRSPAEAATSSSSDSTIPALIEKTASVDARYMHALGPIAMGRISQGESWTVPFEATPGRCYTFIAASDSGVLDMSLDVTFSIPGLPSPQGPLAQKAGTLPVLVLGSIATSPGGCFRNAVPLMLPMVVTLQATRGRGNVGLQIFEK